MCPRDPRPRASFVLVGAVFLGSVLVDPSPAWAEHHCEEEAGVIGGDGQAGAACETPRQSRSTPAVECDPDSREVAYYADPPPDMREDQAERWLQTMRREPEEEGKIWQAAFNCAGDLLGGPHLVPDPDWPDVVAVREEARARVTPPLPVPNVSPSEAVVQLPTWLWIDEGSWEPAAATETDGAVTVRVEARPSSVTWDLVENTHRCEGPGIAWSQEAHDDYEAQAEHVRGVGNPACTFTFVHSSSVEPDDVYSASVTVAWEFSWWLNGEPRGTFGTVERTADFDLRVGEVQALITGH